MIHALTETGGDKTVLQIKGGNMDNQRDNFLYFFMKNNVIPL